MAKKPKKKNIAQRIADAFGKLCTPKPKAKPTTPKSPRKKK